MDLVGIAPVLEQVANEDSNLQGRYRLESANAGKLGVRGIPAVSIPQWKLSGQTEWCYAKTCVAQLD